MSLFTENDLRLLEKTLSIREALVDNLIKKELPTSPKEIDSFTNLLESIDRSILGKAKVKVEDANSKANEETKEILRSLLLNLHSNTEPHGYTSNEASVPEFKPLNLEVNSGELIIGQDQIDMENIQN